MPKLLRFLFPLVLMMLALPGSAWATHEDDPRSSNVVPLGESLRPGGFPPAPALSDANSDLAFWRNYAIQGTYTGFRILDISNPMAPAEVSRVQCGRSQGDITVSEDGRILVRSQDEARILPGNDINQACNIGTAPPTATTPIGQQAVDIGWEGLQIFDISDKANPRFVTAVATDCGSHTHTQYQANNRLIIYVSRGGGGHDIQTPYGTRCPPLIPRITAVEVPLANPAGARVVADIPAGTNGCHDVAVFEELRQMFGACRPMHLHWDISDPLNPRVLHEMTLAGARTPHSASFSWNGRILIAGWEPGGGGDSECEADDPVNEKSIAFFSAETGGLIGLWTLPRPQTNAENCTIHNYNVVPFADRHVLVHGSYQSGTSWVDFTNPGAAYEFAYSDPPALVPQVNAGSWSSYWYNDEVWESDMAAGFAGYTLAERWWRAAFDLSRLNPQTQETLLRCRTSLTTSPARLRATRRAAVTIRATERGGPAAGSPVALQRVVLTGPGIRVTTRTSLNGTARIVGVAATRAGTLRARVPATLNMSGCSATKRILVAPRPPRRPPIRLTGSQ